jgi:ATP-dependent DNA helicase PIF1
MTQEQALAILRSGQSVFLTGSPGSGKTHTINTYVQYLRSHGIEPAITASTGIAATHIHGMTIHSWSGIGINQSLTAEQYEKMTHNKFLSRRLHKASILIIDEISMLSARTLDLVDGVCRKVRNIQRPFGGLQVVLVGDFFQLPPVSRAGEERAQFAFESEAWAELDPAVCYLTEQHRQDDMELLDMLSAVRTGEYNEEHRKQLQARVGRHEKMVGDLPRLFSHNADVDTLNTRELRKLSGGEKEFLMTTHGGEKFVDTLKRGCLSPERLVLKIGASVMCTKNNSELGFINGTLGSVSGFAEEGGHPIVTLLDGSTVTVGPMEWAIEEDGKVRASISQVPLRLAWAMTIHKSQGMSMDAAVIDLGSAFEFGQGYVALSRLRRFSGLYLLGFNERALQVHPEVLSRDEEFHQRSAAAAASLEYDGRSHREQIERDFLMACGGKIAVKEKDRAPGATTQEKPKLPKGEWLAKQRQKYPNAYEPWEEEDDIRLRALFEDDGKISAIARSFGRQPGAIRSRLKKLGLIEE